MTTDNTNLVKPVRRKPWKIALGIFFVLGWLNTMSQPPRFYSSREEAMGALTVKMVFLGIALWLIVSGLRGDKKTS